MTSEQWLALCKEAHGVKIAQDRENGVNVLMVDGLEVWRDWSSDISLCGCTSLPSCGGHNLTTHDDQCVERVFLASPHSY